MKKPPPQVAPDLVLRRKDGTTERIRVAADFRINQHSVFAACAAHAGLYARYVLLCKDAQEAEIYAKQREGRELARALKDLPKVAREGVTERKQRASLSPRVRRAQLRTTEAVIVYAALEMLLKAMSQRGEMLKSMSYEQSREQNSNKL